MEEHECNEDRDCLRGHDEVTAEARRAPGYLQRQSLEYVN